jgi:spore germination protein GerM
MGHKHRKKVLKYFLYVAGCIAVFVIFVKIFSSSLALTQAIAFEWEKQINVYFSNKNMGSSEDCTKVFPLSRTILNAETFGPGAMESLLKGISEDEKTAGYSTGLNSGVLLQKFEIKSKVAYIDFSSGFNEGVAGSCRVQAIKSQIEKTLDAFPDIDSVVISVNGKTEGVLEP